MTTLMETQCISFREIPQTTKLFATFLEDFGRVGKYYGHAPSIAGAAAAAKEVKLDPEVRRGVVEVLREQNQRFGGTAEQDPETARNLDRLANGAVAIVTGQQVGLFTAPAYSIYKAMTAVAYAEELTRQGIEAVPVFWVATEDHDLAEINHAAWTTRTGLAEFAMPVGAGEEGRRVGEITLGGAIAAPVVTAVDTLEGPYAGDVARALRESYAPDETYGSAYAKLMARLVAGRGIILLDPLDARLHRFAAGVYRRALDESDALRDALLARSKELEQGGFHAQVKVARESTLLFYNVDGLRQPLRQRNGKFFAGSATFSAEELRAGDREGAGGVHAQRFAAPRGAGYVACPPPLTSEAPRKSLIWRRPRWCINSLLGRMPAMLPRASFTIIEPPIARLLKEIRVDFRDLLRGRQRLRARDGSASAAARAGQPLRERRKIVAQAAGRVSQAIGAAGRHPARGARAFRTQDSASIPEFEAQGGTRREFPYRSAGSPRANAD